MKDDLMPIVAAYFRQQCSYELGGAKLNVKFGYPEMHHFGSLDHFKFRLRKPKSITDEELRVLSGKICGIEYEPEPYSHRGGVIVKDSDGDTTVIVHCNGVIELGTLYSDKFAEVTNYLRGIGICVDDILLKQGLVEWIE